ncbi:MAG: hypothetical protein JWR63_1899 [Conexibacter sp.]|nr:hypothetical protein [Conexibacter sp.]
MTTTGSPSFWDTTDREPYAFYEEVRRQGEVVWDPNMRAWLVVSSAAARFVLRNDDLFQHPYLTMDAGETYLKIRSGNKRSMMFLRGDEHRAMHRWWIRELLSPAAVERYRPSVVEPAVDRILDSLRGRTAFDLVDDYAERIPVAVFANLLGFEDRGDASLANLKELNDHIGAFASVANSLRFEGDDPDPEHVAIAARAVAAGDELNRILTPMIEARRDGAGDDFISRLWAGGHTVFADWNDLDTLDACRRLLFAGIDTTTHAIANALHMLLNDPALMATARGASPEILQRLADEALRLNGSVQFRPRRATAATTVGNQDIAEGDMLIVLLLAANRDPDRYTCPHEVRLDRETPRDHLAFNYGPRACPAATLARLEVVTAIRAVLAAFPELRSDADAAPAAFTGFLLRSHRPLNVRAGGC